MDNASKIRELRAQATALNKAADALEAADMALGNATFRLPTIEELRSPAKPNMIQAATALLAVSRVSQINAVLRKHGPMTRSEVVKRAVDAGVPESTAKAYLTQKNFNVDKEGRWTAKT